MKAIAMRIRSSFMKVIATITRGRVATKIRGSSMKAIALITRGSSMKAIAMIILGLIAVASLAVMIIFGVRISHLASSIAEGTDSSDVTIKAEAVGISSPSVAWLMPLVQAFAGDSFVVQGTTDLPQGTTSVTMPRININLNENAESQASVEASGWTITQRYTTPDNITSEAILSDNSDNNIIFAATKPPVGQTPSDYVTDFAGQYSSMLDLLGFDISTSSSTSENQLQTVTAEQEDTMVEVRVWIDPGDTNQVNIAVLKSTPEDIRAAADFATFAALLGGA